MTLQQIAYIKDRYKGLKLQRTGTKMFTNKEWAATFKIVMICSDELEPLMNYIKKEDLLAFIGSGHLYLQ